jgi:hypothetical protein
MGVTIHPDGGLLIDDPALEAKIHELCEITGESPEVAVGRAVREEYERRGLNTPPSPEA